jgi:NTP pyrophosphatase (non-canonical NTP hydrolase)
MSMNKLESRQQLLVITMEECGELTQACSKALRKQDLFGQQNLKDEIGDVYAMINLLVEHDVVSWTDLEERVDYKKNKLKKWSDLV